METKADAAPLSTAAIRDDFPAIVAEVRARLEAGKLTYGDDSFERPLAEVVAELRQEALDIIGWGFILCARVKHLERLALEATTPHRPTADAPRVGCPNGLTHQDTESQGFCVCSNRETAPRVPVVMSFGPFHAVIGDAPAAPDPAKVSPFWRGSLVHSAPSSTPHGRPPSPDATGYAGDGAPD